MTAGKGPTSQPGHEQVVRGSTAVRSANRMTGHLAVRLGLDRSKAVWTADVMAESERNMESLKEWMRPPVAEAPTESGHSHGHDHRRVSSPFQHP